ncbi:MAG: thioredoxin [Oscillospiraceae bacterium]
MSVLHITEENFDELINSGKKVIVDFWAPWCGPCKVLGPIIEEFANEVDDNIIVGKVNVDDEQNLAQQFSIMTIPTVIVFKDGKAGNKAVGVINKDQLKDMLID